MRLTNHTRKAAATLTALLLIAVQAGAATVAAVDDETGHAVLVQHRGNCYAVMPEHVAKQDRVSLVSSLPRVAGIGTVFLRNKEEDLALAYVEGSLARVCEVIWNSLRNPVGSLLADPQPGALNRINFGGQFMDRVAATVFDADDTHFYATTSDSLADGNVESGVSGALFVKGNVPVGMALNAVTNSTGRFIRTDRIYALLDEVLEGKVAAHPANQPIKSGSDGLGFRVTGKAVAQGGGLEGLTGATQWPWTGAPIEIELTLSNEAPIPLNRIVLRSTPGDGSPVTPPQRVRIEIDVGMPDQPFWRTLGVNDMSPLGVLEIPTGGTYARRIKLRIESVWHADRPVKLDSITLE